MSYTSKNIILATVLMTVAGMSFANVPVRKTGKRVMHAAPTVKTVESKSIKMLVNSDNVDFTVKGAEDANQAVWSENFDQGKPADWQFVDGKVTHWTTVKTSGSKDFSAYDPDDTGSLYIEGDYRTFNRENAYAFTPQIHVGQNATLAGYIGYSQNYDEYCRLYIAVSTDNFEQDIVELYNTGQESGERTWRWHPVNIDLSDYVGKDVKIRFTYGYGAGDEVFKTGGYMGDFTLDGFELRTATSIEKIDVMTGDKVTFVDLTPEGEAVAWQWSFPGAVPATSTEKSPTVYYTEDGAYDVTLTVTDKDGNELSKTKGGFVNVTGTTPVAKIGLPASFREYNSRLPLIAPLGEVVYTDASSNFPSEHRWEFSGISPDNTEKTYLEGDSVKVQYHFMGEQSVSLEASNSHGSSVDNADITVAYDGLITNLNPGDFVTTFDLDGRGEFPGTNTMKITAYAEKFSKPSRPIMIEGAYIYFNKCSAEELYDQVQSIGVHLCASENGLPGKKLDSFWWSVVDINYDVTNGLVSGFPFTYNPIVDDEFFIVVDGIPAKNDGCTISFYMADFRGENNSAYMLKDDKWIDVSTYFPAGKNHTSYAIFPSVYHSVMSNLPIGADKSVKFDKNGGSKEYEFFSYMGYETPVKSSDDWVRVTNEPNGMTVDTLIIEADPLPAGMSERTANLTLTDGASTFTIPVSQDSTNDALTIETSDSFSVSPTSFKDYFEVSAPAQTLVTVYDLSGRLMYKTMTNAQGSCRVDTRTWASGLYLVKAGNAPAVKVNKN